ncbi:GAF domain-containing sensor histidine kinase [Salirhabdus sp. Marseille-P4669]|uniref:GAF domain-containing sensor histidine kinase n=1 Tax=Salirhabdus sp. Marseille-P4669 TaxID=2042310 RepID=UPI000C7DFD05|nr:GAF domain-containing sensor histidine kinase [Salirhabdus sp. Marseille-P4669]
MGNSFRQEEIHILKEIAELLNEGIEIKTVLSEVLKKLLHVTGFQTGWIFLVNEEGKHELAASESLPAALSQNGCKRMRRKNCWCVDRYRNGKLTKASNIIECHRIERAIAEKSEDTGGITHHATVPLMAGEERFGVLNVGSPYKTFFEPEELALLESIAYQIGTALKRIKLTQSEQEMALIAERNRLARDLHDSVNQLLFSLSLTARAGKEMAEKETEKETFQYIQDLAQDALGEMRGLIWQLRPSGLENGIIHGLTEYAKVLGLQLNQHIKGVIRLSQRIEEALWRIGQEAMANCKKHAGTDEIFLEMKKDNKMVEMKIYDHGVGFHYDATLELPSLGLKSMKQRAERLGGSFELKSRKGKGTWISIQIPLQMGD